ncbi:MAG: DUF2812 domain-containing protein [Oscillospiraceae bacterium]|nr:DUF2812 domain-containing protein [Oscillospiraceae bacterium]
MTKKVYRYFGGFTEKQATWLNRMATEGWRLIRTGKIAYEFESCEPGKVQYAVEFIADKSQKNAEDYKAFLEGCGYKVWYKNANLSYSIGKVRWRPWAEADAQITTSRTTYNKELLIVEKENDGKPFELHTTAADRIVFLKKLRNVWLTYTAMFLFMAILFLLQAQIASAVLGGIGLLSLIPVVLYQVQISKMKKMDDFQE